MSMHHKTITICSTARLVRGVVLQHQQQQLASGAAQWQTPEIYTLQQWLDTLLNHAVLLGLVPSDALPTLTLNAMAEAFLWEQAIETCLAKHEAAALFDICAMAKSAIEANQLLCHWQISEAEINSHFMSTETRQFLRWRHTFEALCAKQNAIESARLTALQVALIEQYQLQNCAELQMPAEIFLTGFDRTTPLETHLFTMLEAAGMRVTRVAHNAASHVSVHNMALNDANAECRAAVAWAQGKLAENPQAQLAIISPALGSVRRELLDLLDDTFHPETLQTEYCELPRCYDFSLGLALTEYPIVHSALQLLRLASSKANISFDEVTPILQDVYWGEATEMDARAQLDAHLRKNLNASYSLDSLLKQAKKLAQYQLEETLIETMLPPPQAGEGWGEGANRNFLKLDSLIKHLTEIMQFQAQAGQRQSPSEWVLKFTSLLDALQWAKSRNLSSHEYQAQQALIKCLNELSALDTIFGKLTSSEAAQKLAELCGATMFQAEAKGDIHIQILGLLETPATQLDAVWAMNMNDQHWPPPVNLNPLLPADLQRSCGVPNASAAIQNEFACLVQQRLLVSAPEVIFSYALKDETRELRPSPLLLPVNPSGKVAHNNPFVVSLSNHEQPFDSSASSPLRANGIDADGLNSEIPIIKTLAERLAQPTALQKLDDFMAPAISETEKTRGGTSLLARQAICPAWAFYQNRLGAGKLETPIDGLDNMSRGSLLHKVLQIFWQNCKTSSRLKAYSEAQLQAAIDSAIEQSITTLAQELSYNIPPQILQIERQRIQQLMQIWLAVEMARADFSVDACEKKVTLEVEGLTLNLTIDRIDVLDDASGGLVVLDYKTGSAVSTRSWADERIAEPQLPIYAVLALTYEPVAAVSFAKISADETKLIGLTQDENVLPDVTALYQVKSNSAFKSFADWQTLLEHWHTSLTNIAKEIKVGVASVTFEKESDLAYCDVKPLLRLPERMLQFEQMQVALSEEPLAEVGDVI